MTKKGLIKAVAGKSNKSEETTKIIVENVFSTILETASNGEKVTIQNFGRFEQKTYKEKNVINPRTKEMMKVEPYNKLKFTASAKFD